MTWIKDFIDNLPALVGYIAPGFLLVGLFAWTTSSSFKNGTTLVVVSAVASFVIWSICGSSFAAATGGRAVIVCAVSTLVGLVSAIVYKTAWFNDLIARIGIKRTTNGSIWDDVVGEGCWIAAFSAKEKINYCGIFRYQKCEDGVSYVVLSKYYETNKAGRKILKDYTQDEGRMMMLQIKNYDEIIISKEDPFGHFKAR